MVRRQTQAAAKAPTIEASLAAFPARSVEGFETIADTEQVGSAAGWCREHRSVDALRGYVRRAVPRARRGGVPVICQMHAVHIAFVMRARRRGRSPKRSPPPKIMQRGQCRGRAWQRERLARRSCGRNTMTSTATADHASRAAASLALRDRQARTQPVQSRSARTPDRAHAAEEIARSTLAGLHRLNDDLNYGVGVAGADCDHPVNPVLGRVPVRTTLDVDIIWHEVAGLFVIRHYASWIGVQARDQTVTLRNFVAGWAR